jgi:hypothetical protein
MNMKKSELKSLIKECIKEVVGDIFIEVYNEVRQAYKGDKFTFKASHEVSRDEAYKIMKKIVPEYNDFKAEKILNLPEDSMIKIAREYSVCLYVRTSQPISKKFANEVDFKDGVWRLWWD